MACSVGNIGTNRGDRLLFQPGNLNSTLLLHTGILILPFAAFIKKNVKFRIRDKFIVIYM